MGDGCLDDRVRGVEVSVREVVAQAGDLTPGNRGLAVRELCRQRPDRLADLEQPDTDRVEDQPVGEVTARPMGGDGGDGLG